MIADAPPHPNPPPFALWVDVISPLADVAVEHILQAVGEAVFTTLSPARTHGTPPAASIKVADDADVQTLNRDFRGQDKPTNVLSFPTDDTDATADTDPTDPQFYLGDIIMAVGTLMKEAEAQNKPLAHHFTHLAVHGLLHLMGFDHETEDEAAIMEALEVKILAKLNINNPYEN